MQNGYIGLYLSIVTSLCEVEGDTKQFASCQY